MERREIPEDARFFEKMASSRVIVWDELPAHKEVISPDGNKRIVIEAGDYPMVHDLTVTLEGRVSRDDFAPICRYGAREFKQGNFPTEHSLDFYALSNEGLHDSVRYVPEGAKAAGSMKKVEVSISAGFDYRNWYIDTMAMPGRTDFWAVRDAFLRGLAVGDFGKPAIVADKPFLRKGL